MTDTLKKCKERGGRLIKGVCIVRKGKELGTEKGTLSHPIAFFISLLVFTIILLIPLLGIGFALIGMVISLFVMRGRMKPRQRGDLLKIFGIMLFFVFVWIMMGYLSFATIPFWKILIAGFVADLISFIFGFFEVTTAPTVVLPFILSIIEGFVVFILVMIIISGWQGIILGVISGLIALLIPIPFPLLITATFIILKLISGVIGQIIGEVI